MICVEAYERVCVITRWLAQCVRFVFDPNMMCVREGRVTHDYLIDWPSNVFVQATSVCEWLCLTV